MCNAHGTATFKAQAFSYATYVHIVHKLYSSLIASFWATSKGSVSWGETLHDNECVKPNTTLKRDYITPLYNPHSEAMPKYPLRR